MTETVLARRYDDSGDRKLDTWGCFSTEKPDIKTDKFCVEATGEFSDCGKGDGYACQNDETHTGLQQIITNKQDHCPPGKIISFVILKRRNS